MYFIPTLFLFLVRRNSCYNSSSGSSSGSSSDSSAYSDIESYRNPYTYCLNKEDHKHHSSTTNIQPINLNCMCYFLWWLELVDKSSKKDIQTSDSRVVHVDPSVTWDSIGMFPFHSLTL